MEVPVKIVPPSLFKYKPTAYERDGMQISESVPQGQQSGPYAEKEPREKGRSCYYLYVPDATKDLKK